MEASIIGVSLIDLTFGIFVSMHIDDTNARFTRRRFIALAGALACMPLLSRCAVKGQPITIGMQTWPGYEPTSLAQTMGWLDEKQVRLVKTTSATDSMQQLEQGKIDGAGLTLDEVLRARENGIPLSVILVCDISAGADQFIVHPRIKSLAEIKGLRIGAEEGALGALMLYEVLLAAGLKIEDVKPVSLTADQHVAAWKRGEVDAVVTYEPAARQILAMGGKKLFDSRMIPDLIVDVLAVRTKLLDAAHGDALRALVSSHLKSLTYIQTNPDDAAYRMAPHFKLPPEEVLNTFRGLVLPDLENNVRLLGTAKPVLLKSAEKVADLMLKAGILRKQADLNGLIHPEYLPKSDS